MRGIGMKALACAAVCLQLAFWAAPAIADADIAVTVNGRAIETRQLNEAVAAQIASKPLTRQELLNRSIDAVLIGQRVVALGLEPELPQGDLAVFNAQVGQWTAKHGYALGLMPSLPTPQAVKAFYDEHPHLFSKRRIYDLREVKVEAAPAQHEAIKAKLKTARNLDEILAYLKARGLQFSGSKVERKAEQLPMANLDAIAAMKDGDAMVSPFSAGLTILYLNSSRTQALSLEQASEAIQTFLFNQERRVRLDAEVLRLRQAATLQGFGEFASVGR